jgi:hypothetical protein
LSTRSVTEALSVPSEHDSVVPAADEDSATSSSHLPGDVSVPQSVAAGLGTTVQVTVTWFRHTPSLHGTLLPFDVHEALTDALATPGAAAIAVATTTSNNGRRSFDIPQ